ncbi:MAG: response regulator transcription factor [Candidatus Obscuribacterales bacterium]|nr:response regulator transcription factor [Candidatus Obscuribacterales bacterium]
MASKILIVDDHPVVRLGVSTIVQNLGMELIGDASDASKALDLLGGMQPQSVVVLMDIEMPGMNGIEATKRIKASFPLAKVIVLSSSSDENSFFAAFGAGADGFCNKLVTADELRLAIETVLEGKQWLDPLMTRTLLNKFRSDSVISTTTKPRQDFALSGREKEVLMLMVEGLSNKQISDQLVITVDTVKAHVKHVLSKLDCADRTQACVKAIRENILNGFPEGATGRITLPSSEAKRTDT